MLGMSAPPTAWSSLLISPVDLYGCHVPAFDPARLSAHFLWLLLERMVLVAGHCGSAVASHDQPIQLPVMSRRGARHTPECDCYYTAGHVSNGEPEPWQERGRER